MNFNYLGTPAGTTQRHRLNKSKRPNHPKGPLFRHLLRTYVVLLVNGSLFLVGLLAVRVVAE